MVLESFLKRGCHNNLTFTSSTSHLSHTSQTKTTFSSPRVAPRWPHMWPRCPQDAPKTGQDSPNMAVSMPTMAQEGSLKRRCHNNPKIIPSTSYVLHTSRTKTLFSSRRVAPKWPHIWPRCPQDAPKTGQDSPKMAISVPTMAQEGLLQRRCHNNLNFTSPTSYFGHTSRAKTLFSCPRVATKWPQGWPSWPKTPRRSRKHAFSRGFY